jgi:hypothetical protein
MREGEIGQENINKSKPLQLVTTNISLFEKRAPE